MPHPVTPPSGDAPPPPSQETINDLLNTIFTAKTSASSIDACYGLCEILLSSVGVAGLNDYGVITEIKKAAADKKSGLRRESGQNLLGAVLERFLPRQPISEVVLLLQDSNLVGVALDALSDKGAVVRDAAQYGLDATFGILSPEALITGLLPALVEYLSKKTGKWQGTVGAYKLLQKMADKAKVSLGGTKEEAIEKDLLRESLGAKLAGLIPIVEGGMHDLKSEVEKQAVATMNSLTTLLSNDDVAPRIPLLVDTMQHPSSQTLQKAIHALSQTTFVAIVTSPVLALLTPFLERSLNSPTTAQEVLRQTVVIVENLTKLVHDPIEARTFLPKLIPGVKSVCDRASLPEVREIAERALATMEKAMGDDKDVVARTSGEDVAKVLDEQIKANGGLASQQELFKQARPYISDMVAIDVNYRYVNRISGRIAPYIKTFLKDAEAPKRLPMPSRSTTSRRMSASTVFPRRRTMARLRLSTPTSLSPTVVCFSCRTPTCDFSRVTATVFAAETVLESRLSCEVSRTASLRASLLRTFSALVMSSTTRARMLISAFSSSLPRTPRLPHKVLSVSLRFWPSSVSLLALRVDSLRELDLCLEVGR
ncbi:hypothetical protein NXS19_005251 [Fusarium pseudograminearum]|nr:hypothetical protein NXS19_005251 [Fusarium pseudograminearum]